MITHRLFNIGDIIYCLLSSAKEPNILLPMKGIIIDIQWHEYNPRYLIKFIKFYDTYRFIKKYFYNMSFTNKFEDHTREITFNKKDFKWMSEFNAYLVEKKWQVVVDSVMCVKSKPQLKKLFNKVQYALISQLIKDLRHLSTRLFYTGFLKIASQKEFDIRLKDFIGDKFENNNEVSFDVYIDWIKNRY